MKKKKLIEIVSEGCLKCDNIKCDYTDTTIKVEDYKDWIDVPCPDCKKNLLTLEDYERSVSLRVCMDMVNNMTPEEIKVFSKILPDGTLDELLKNNNLKEDDKVEIKIDTHKEIRIIDIKKSEDKK